MNQKISEESLEKELEMINNHLLEIKMNIKNICSLLDEQQTLLIEQKRLLEIKTEELRIFRNKYPFNCKINV